MGKEVFCSTPSSSDKRRPQSDLRGNFSTDSITYLGSTLQDQNSLYLGGFCGLCSNNNTKTSLKLWNIDLLQFVQRISGEESSGAINESKVTVLSYFL